MYPHAYRDCSIYRDCDPNPVWRHGSYDLSDWDEFFVHVAMEYHEDNDRDEEEHVYEIEVHQFGYGTHELTAFLYVRGTNESTLVPFHVCDV